MTYASRILLWRAAVSTLTITSVWGQNEYQICGKPLEQGLKEYSVESQSRSFLDNVFDRYCDQTGESKSSSASLGINALIDSLPIGLKGSSGDSSQKQASFCKNYASTRSQVSNESYSHERTATEAFKSFDSCIGLLVNKQVIIQTHITSREALDFYVATGTMKSVQLQGISYPDKIVSCLGHDPRTKKSVSFDESTSFETGNGGAISFSCKRPASSVDSGGKHYDEAYVTVKTSEGNYSLYLPPDMLPALPTVTGINDKLNDLQIQLNTPIPAAIATIGGNPGPNDGTGRNTVYLKAEEPGMSRGGAIHVKDNGIFEAKRKGLYHVSIFLTADAGGQVFNAYTAYQVIKLTSGQEVVLGSYGNFGHPHFTVIDLDCVLDTGERIEVTYGNSYNIGLSVTGNLYAHWVGY